jgi:hypothetical protein
MRKLYAKYLFALNFAQLKYNLEQFLPAWLFLLFNPQYGTPVQVPFALDSPLLPARPKAFPSALQAPAHRRRLGQGPCVPVAENAGSQGCMMSFAKP